MYNFEMGVMAGLLLLSFSVIAVGYVLRDVANAIREQTRYNRELWGSPKEWNRAKTERAPWQ